MFNCKKIVLSENDINSCEHAGVNISSSSNTVLEKNKSWKNFYGIQVYECNSISLIGNKLFQNFSGFKATNSSQIDFSSSNVSANNGTNTGISLDNSDIILTGNNITGNNGNGVLLTNNSTAIISQNNIFENAGYAINNENQNVNIDVSNNWWGDKNGPANGSIKGDATVSNCLSAPVSLASKTRRDTVYVVEGITDSAHVFFQNLNTPDDILDITVSDNEGWVTSPKTFSAVLKDSTGISANLIFSIPNNVNSGIVNKIFIEALSRNDKNLSVRDSFCIAIYTPELYEMLVGPDSTTITSGDSLHLTVNGYDQFGNSVNINPVWHANIGEISPDGLFKCSQLGTATITATDLVTGKKGIATVIVSDIVKVKEEEEVMVEFNLYQNYPNPFNPTTTIEFALPVTGIYSLKIYNVLGQEVTTLVNKEMKAGLHEITFDAGILASGMYIYRLSGNNISLVKKLMLIK